ncbi:MAG: hypothetical protein FD167_1475 [bacterium]|nr:MAG: hypothetical protein FD167_1475 [bacterium]
MSNLTQTPDILIAFDAEAIVAKGKGTSDSPLYAGNENIYMITRHGSVLSGNAGGELNVQVAVGDVIRWRSSTLSQNFDYDVLLYRFESTDSNHKLLSNPESMSGDINEPVPNTDNPLQPGKQDVTNYYWQATAKKIGSVTYNFFFMITDRSGNVYGYYRWDPFITINNKD